MRVHSGKGPFQECVRLSGKGSILGTDVHSVKASFLECLFVLGTCTLLRTRPRSGNVFSENGWPFCECAPFSERSSRSGPIGQPSCFATDTQMALGHRGVWDAQDVTASRYLLASTDLRSRPRRCPRKYSDAGAPPPRHKFGSVG